MVEEQEEGHVPGSSSITTGRRILILARSFHQNTGRVTGDIVTSDWLRQLPAQQIVRCTSRLLLYLICTPYFLFDFLSDPSLHHSTRLFSFLYIRFYHYIRIYWITWHQLIWLQPYTLRRLHPHSHYQASCLFSTSRAFSKTGEGLYPSSPR